MYATNACASSAAYEFTKDFDDIARPGLVRFLKHFGLAVEPEEDEDPADFDLTDSGDEAREYLRQLRGGLKRRRSLSSSSARRRSAIPKLPLGRERARSR
jgi:hypothetical protein